MSKKKKVTQKKNQKKDNNSRVKKNEYLYRNEEDLFITKQQKFNFSKSDLEDELDFKATNKKKDKSLEKNVVIIEKKIFPKKIIIILVIFLIGMIGFNIYHFISFDHHKEKIVTKLVEKEVVPENIVFLGDSITDNYDLETYFPDVSLVNSGISGDATQEILKDMKNRVYRYNPSKVILLIGTNDIAQGKTAEETFESIKKIVEEIQDNRKQAKIYIQSVYPVNETIDEEIVGQRNNEDIIALNQKLEEYCIDKKLVYIDIYNSLIDENKRLMKEYTKEGLHISKKGYELITEKLKKYIYDK